KPDQAQKKPSHRQRDQRRHVASQVFVCQVVHESNVRRRRKKPIRILSQRVVGSSTVKVEPGPSLLRAVTVPWCWVTIQRAMDNPMPAPAPDREGSTR